MFYNNNALRLEGGGMDSHKTTVQTIATLSKLSKMGISTPQKHSTSQPMDNVILDGDDFNLT